MPPRPPTIKIEVIKGNGIGPHGNGAMARYPIGRGQTDTYYSTKPIGTGTISLPQHGDKNNSLDSSFACRYNYYHVEFQKYFLVKNLKVLLEMQVPEYPHMRQRLMLNGVVLEDHKELSEYGITAAGSSTMTLKMFLIDDFAPKAHRIEGPRQDSSGRRTWQAVMNPNALTGRDFSSTVGTFVP